MHLCVYLFVYIYLYLFIFIYIYLYLFIFIYIYLLIYAFMCLFVRLFKVCLYLHIFPCIFFVLPRAHVCLLRLLGGLFGLRAMCRGCWQDRFEELKGYVSSSGDLWTMCM